MIGGLRNHMIGLSQQGQQSWSAPRAGLVSSYDPASYAVKVKLQPPPAEGDAAETGWLPIKTQWAGSGFGLAIGPAIGDHAICVFLEGNIEAGVCLGFLFDDESRPPPVPSGEAWLVHSSGSFFKMLTDGTVHVKGDTTIDGNLIVTKDITDNHGGNGVTVKQLRDAYDAHKHTGVTAGAASTGTTDHPVP